VVFHKQLLVEYRHFRTASRIFDKKLHTIPTDIFKVMDAMALFEDLFSAVWRRGKSSETAGILDLPKLASGPVS